MNICGKNRQSCAQAAAHSVAIVARADQESLGSWSAAVSPVSPRDAHRVTDQWRADHRAHLAACWLRGHRPVGEWDLQSRRSHRTEHGAASNGNNRVRPTRHRTMPWRSDAGRWLRTLIVDSSAIDRAEAGVINAIWKSPWLSHEIFPPCEHRRGGGVRGNWPADRAKVANAPQSRQAFAFWAQRGFGEPMEILFYSGFVLQWICRVLPRDTRKANSYQF